jgi:hypothetical protein
MKTYYARTARVSFSINVKDENGKPMWQQNPITGALLMQDGKPIPVQRFLQFSTISENPKIGYLCKYEADNQDEIDRLEQLCNDASSGVMREDDYKKSRNPEAYQREQEKKVMETELIQLRERVAKAEEKGTKAAAMEDEITRLTKELDEARKSGAGGHKKSGG